MRLALALGTIFISTACLHRREAEQGAAWSDAATFGSGMEVALEPVGVPIAAPVSSPRPAAEILVTPDTEVGYPTEVLGVLDFHSPVQSQDKGFDELRARAAALGADAVIHAEFEHGEDGGLSHLSGMVVRAR